MFINKSILLKSVLYIYFFLCNITLGFELPNIELDEKMLFNNKVKVLIPNKFSIMDDDIAVLKYPSPNRPQIIFTDDSATVNCAFNLTIEKASQRLIPKYESKFVLDYMKMPTSLKLISSGVEEINGRKVGYLEILTRAVDTNVYNLIFFTDVNEKLLLCTFNCTVEYRNLWEPIANKIMRSLTIL